MSNVIPVEKSEGHPETPMQKILRKADQKIPRQSNLPPKGERKLVELKEEKGLSSDETARRMNYLSVCSTAYRLATAIAHRSDEFANGDEIGVIQDFAYRIGLIAASGSTLLQLGEMAEPLGVILKTYESHPATINLHDAFAHVATELGFDLQDWAEATQTPKEN